MFESLVSMLRDPATTQWTHTDLEDRLAAAGRELLRRLTQDHLDLRAEREQPRNGVVDAGGVARTRVECGHERTLATVYGPVRRKAYRAPGVENLYPANAVLNLPGGKHSHGLRRLAAVEATRGSFEEAAAAIGRATGTRIGKRQVEDLTWAAAVDVQAFYAATARRRPQRRTSWCCPRMARGCDAPGRGAGGHRPIRPVPQAVHSAVQGREA